LKTEEYEKTLPLRLSNLPMIFLILGWEKNNVRFDYFTALSTFSFSQENLLLPIFN